MNKDSIFQKRRLQPGDTDLLACENFVLGIKRETEGWFVKVFEENTSVDTVDPEEITSGEYFHTGKSNSFIIAPALHSKPLVFKGSRIFIAPHQKLTFFVKIPVIFQLYFSKISDENLLKEIPSRRLSDTWFGDPDNGIAAFALDSTHQLNFSDVETSAMEACCPVSIFNNCNQPLDVQRLIIKTDNMMLFEHNNKMVTSVVKLEYKGKDALSSASYGSSKLYHGENPVILANARSNDTKNLLKTNFHFIRNIYNRVE